jgi:hypothetical protein
MFFKSNQAHFSPITTLMSTPSINHKTPTTTFYTIVYRSFRSPFANNPFIYLATPRPNATQFQPNPGDFSHSSSDRALEFLQYGALRDSTKIYLGFRFRADFSFSNTTNSYRADTYLYYDHLGSYLTEPTVLFPTQPIPSAPSFLIPGTRYLNVKTKISTYNNSAPYFKAKIFGGIIMAPNVKAKISGEETSFSLLIQDSTFPTHTHTITFYLHEAENPDNKFARKLTSDIIGILDTHEALLFTFCSQFVQNFGKISTTLKLTMVSYKKNVSNKSSSSSTKKKSTVSAKSQKTAARKKAQAFKASLINEIEMEEIEQLVNSPSSSPSKHTVKKSKSSPSSKSKVIKSSSPTNHVRKESKKTTTKEDTEDESAKKVGSEMGTPQRKNKQSIYKPEESPIKKKPPKEGNPIPEDASITTVHDSPVRTNNSDEKQVTTPPSLVRTSDKSSNPMDTSSPSTQHDKDKDTSSNTEVDPDVIITKVTNDVTVTQVLKPTQPTEKNKKNEKNTTAAKVTETNTTTENTTPEKTTCTTEESTQAKSVNPEEASKPQASTGVNLPVGKPRTQSNRTSNNMSLRGNTTMNQRINSTFYDLQLALEESSKSEATQVLQKVCIKFFQILQDADPSVIVGNFTHTDNRCALLEPNKIPSTITKLGQYFFRARPNPAGVTAYTSIRLSFDGDEDSLLQQTEFELSDNNIRLYRRPLQVAETIRKCWLCGVPSSVDLQHLQASLLTIMRENQVQGLSVDEINQTREIPMALRRQVVYDGAKKAKTSTSTDNQTWTRKPKAIHAEFPKDRAARGYEMLAKAVKSDSFKSFYRGECKLIPLFDHKASRSNQIKIKRAITRHELLERSTESFEITGLINLDSMDKTVKLTPRQMAMTFMPPDGTTKIPLVLSLDPKVSDPETCLATIPIRIREDSREFCIHFGAHLRMKFGDSVLQFFTPEKKRDIIATTYNAVTKTFSNDLDRELDDMFEDGHAPAYMLDMSELQTGDTPINLDRPITNAEGATPPTTGVQFQFASNDDLVSNQDSVSTFGTMTMDPKNIFNAPVHQTTPDKTNDAGTQQNLAQVTPASGKSANDAISVMDMTTTTSFSKIEERMARNEQKFLNTENLLQVILSCLTAPPPNTNSTHGSSLPAAQQNSSLESRTTGPASGIVQGEPSRESDDGTPE